MATERVYQFDYFDRVIKHNRRSVDYATADAIAAAKGTILGETVRVVDEDLLNDWDFIRAGDMPPREIPEKRRWIRPPRPGPVPAR